MKPPLPNSNTIIRRDAWTPTSGMEVVAELGRLKSKNMAPLWASCTCRAKRSSTEELQEVVRKSFSTDDYYRDLVRQTQSTQDSYQAPVIVMSSLSILMGALIVPALDIPNNLKNILGLISLFGPLFFIGLNIISPGFRITLQAKSINENKLDRISYHEAGHFLAGYLLGIPILSYDISGENDAGTAIETDFTDISQGYELNLDKIGALLVIAMSGMVAESLRFGNSLGGSEDFSVAYSIMREYGVPMNKREDYLKNGIMNSLLLLRQYRDGLDEVAFAMRATKSLTQCFEAIESGEIIYS
jgi:hypothetical protein